MRTEMGVKVRKHFTRTKGTTWVETEELWEDGEDSLTNSPHEVEILKEEGEITPTKNLSV
jgi:hypothetical protein